MRRPKLAKGLRGFVTAADPTRTAKLTVEPRATSRNNKLDGRRGEFGARRQPPATVIASHANPLPLRLLQSASGDRAAQGGHDSPLSHVRRPGRRAGRGGTRAGEPAGRARTTGLRAKRL